MNEEKTLQEKEGWYTLSGDVNSDMVHRMFEAVASMTEEGIDTAHVLLQSNGGYVSDGLCLYNFMASSPIKFVMYNAGAVASIAVVLYLSGSRRYASETARFMIHKSHATASPGSRRPISAAVAPRSPLPGVSRLIASRRLVLPAPFGPCSTTVPPETGRVAPA